MDEDAHMDVVAADLADPLVQSACQLALAAWRVLRCRGAGRITLGSIGWATQVCRKSWRYVVICSL